MRVKIRKDDTVEMISGREADKGKRGKVIKVMPDEGKVVVLISTCVKSIKDRFRRKVAPLNLELLNLKPPLRLVM